MKQLPIFVYGTLRPGYGNYEWALQGKTYQEVSAKIYGFTMFNGPGFPYMTYARPDLRVDATSVTGTLVWLDPVEYDWILQALDHLEGFIEPAHPDNHYECIITIVEANEQPVEAYAYVATPYLMDRLWEHREEDIIPSGDWVDAT